MRRVLKIEPFHVDVVDGETENYGEYDSDKRLIVIRKGLNPDDYADTLLHEVSHVLPYVAGVRRVIMTASQEEEYIRATTPFMLSALRNNRWLLRALGLVV